jgi:hypothetical protein
MSRFEKYFMVQNNVNKFKIILHKSKTMFTDVLNIYAYRFRECSCVKNIFKGAKIYFPLLN